MKAITLTQPWATLMYLQQKRVETRSRPFYYVGDVVIHAAKGFPKECRLLCATEPFRTALGGLKDTDLPLGVGLCVVRFECCVKTDEVHKIAALGLPAPNASEIAFGDYTSGRFAIATTFQRQLDPPFVPARGMLGLWDWGK